MLKDKKNKKTDIIQVNKTKRKKTLLEKEALKNYVFEKIAFGETIDEIAKSTGYSNTHISMLSKEIDDEFMLEIKSDRETKIKKQIRKLEGITKLLYRTLKSDGLSIKEQVALHGEILKTNEYIAKLQGLLVTTIEADVKSSTTSELLNGFGIFTNE